MSFDNIKYDSNIGFYIPDNESIDSALNRTTHMAIAAHQDDIEMMAYDGILKSFKNSENYFFGVVCTNGAGKVKSNLYTTFSEKEMIETRNNEQIKAATIGKYSGVAFLNSSSSDVKTKNREKMKQNLKYVILKSRPKVLYTHNPFDKHDTHVAVLIILLEVLREIKNYYKPDNIYGCELWGGLDWLVSNDKVLLDISGNENLELALIKVYESQIRENKRYDIATIGRRRSNATFDRFDEADKGVSATIAVNLNSLILDDNLMLEEFCINVVKNFREDVSKRIKRLTF